MRKYVIMGVQGSGKGTQAKMLAEDLDLVHISVGDIFRWNVQNHTKVGAQVRRIMASATTRNGITTSSRLAGPRMVRNVRGVIGVTNSIMVKPAVTPETVEEIIEGAFKREAEVDARHIKVEVSDHTVMLYGHVHSLKEANAATAAAAAAPGIAKVESHLVVSP
ncbi:MAG: nucleoside monophosphate kinase [Xanthobacteraceae bacterium]